MALVIIRGLCSSHRRSHTSGPSACSSCSSPRSASCSTAWGIDHNRAIGARDPFLDANRPDTATSFTNPVPSAPIGGVRAAGGPNRPGLTPMDPVLTPPARPDAHRPRRCRRLILLCSDPEVAYWTGPLDPRVSGDPRPKTWPPDGSPMASPNGWRGTDPTGRSSGAVASRGSTSTARPCSSSVGRCVTPAPATVMRRTGPGGARLGRGTPAGSADRSVHRSAQPCLAGSHGAARHAAGGHHPTCRTRRGPDGRAPRRRLRSVPTLSGERASRWPGPARLPKVTAGALGAALRPRQVRPGLRIDRPLTAATPAGTSSGSQPMTRQTCGSPPQFGHGGTRSDMTAARRARVAGSSSSGMTGAGAGSSRPRIGNLGPSTVKAPCDLSALTMP